MYKAKNVYSPLFMFNLDFLKKLWISPRNSVITAIDSTFSYQIRIQYLLSFGISEAVSLKVVSL